MSRKKPIVSPARSKTKKSSAKPHVPTPKKAVNQQETVSVRAVKKPKLRLPFGGQSSADGGSARLEVVKKDAWWLVTFVFTVYICVSLFSFDVADLGARSADDVRNWGGRLGAIVSGYGFSAFGRSFWWCVLVLWMWLYHNFRLLGSRRGSPYNFWVAGVGLSILLICSPVLEVFVYYHEWRKVLPLGAGGAVGDLLAAGIYDALGSPGSSLFIGSIAFLGITLILQLSWLEMLEKFGSLLEWLLLKLLKWIWQLVLMVWNNLKQTQMRSQPVPIAPEPEKLPDSSDVGVEKIQNNKKFAFKQRLNQVKNWCAKFSASVANSENKPQEANASSEECLTQMPPPAVSEEQVVVDDSTSIDQNAVVQDIPEIAEIKHAQAMQLQETVAPFVPTGKYQLPKLNLLLSPPLNRPESSDEEVAKIGQNIKEKLAEFGVEVEVKDNPSVGAVVTRFEIEPAKGVTGNRIVNRAKDLARSLSLQSVRVVETLVGKNTMGIEIPNKVRQGVFLSEILSSDNFVRASSRLTVALGKNIDNEAVVDDLAKMPHLLVGGMTGSGKSVGVNAMIMSILFKATPEEVRFIMIDPKMLELSVYDGIGHLLCPVITNMKEAGNALNWCVAEMERRYRLLSHLGVRNLSSFNEKIALAKASEHPVANPFSLSTDEPEPLEKLPQIVVVIDELADLMMTERKSVEQQIARLAQKARAAGIHMIIATQRPSVDVITGLIKANIPTRMAFTVQSRIDSRTILDKMGAEDLLKNGDLLYLSPGNEPMRLQGAFVSDDEVHQVVSFIKQQGEPDYITGILTGEALLEKQPSTQASNSTDEMYEQALTFVVDTRKTSISALQRHLRIGYNRAANLMQDLENAGVVSAPELGGNRRILIALPEKGD